MAYVRKENVSHDRLLEVLDYDPDLGLFRWRMSLRKGTAGKVAGKLVPYSPSKKGSGYVYVRIDKKMYLAHRLAWFYVHGVWPAEQIDHKNRDRGDNRICNLRPATNAQNTHNSEKLLKAKGYTREPNGRYRAQASLNGKTTNLGRYETPEEARAAYVKAVSEVRRRDD